MVLRSGSRVMIIKGADKGYLGEVRQSRTDYTVLDLDVGRTVNLPTTSFIEIDPLSGIPISKIKEKREEEKMLSMFQDLDVDPIVGVTRKLEKIEISKSGNNRRKKSRGD
jgi:hypothetical protein